LFPHLNFISKFGGTGYICSATKWLGGKASICFASLNIFPRHKALRAMAHLVTSPEESTPAPINSFDNRFRELHSRHEVEGDGA
jgi:hypothetical protein